MSVPKLIIKGVKIVGKWNWLEKMRCVVCNLPLESVKDEIVYCPHCRLPAHKKHILEWLHGHSVCPCPRKLPLREDQLIKSRGVIGEG